MGQAKDDIFILSKFFNLFAMKKLLLYLFLFPVLGLLHRNVDAQFNFGVSHEGYLHGNGISVLTYHNQYFIGKQGGIEIIQYDRRIMSNGMLVYKLQNENRPDDTPEYFTQPVPETEPIQPVTDQKKCLIKMNFRDENINLVYDLVVQGYDTAFSIDLDFQSLPDAGVLEELSFEIELFPGIYRGRSFAFDNEVGFFPLNFHHPVLTENGNYFLSPMGRGNRLVIAPETPEYSMEITAQNASLVLLDTRNKTDHNWYTLKAEINIGQVKQNKVSLVFKPGIIRDYIKKPVIGYSQPGYHPDQNKKIVIEADQKVRVPGKIALFKYAKEEGKFHPLLSETPEFWGKYNRYHIFTFDFSSIKEEGLYYLSMEEEGVHTRPFRISRDIYREGIWQPALETFLPVQMCHMRVQDRNRIWHGCCHMDDAMQAPAPLMLFDGFSQGESTDTPYKAYETIPGLNKGGWHDAGDDDVNFNSTGRTVYHLALIREEFGIETDQTSIDFDKREVFLHRPDGESDLIQNIKHGLNFMLGSYEGVGHGIVGMISNDFATYFIPGTWGHMTDQLFYDPGLDENSRNATHSGKKDDRFAFTNKDVCAEFRNAWMFAASSRALQGSDDSLSQRCLELA